MSTSSMAVLSEAREVPRSLAHYQAGTGLRTLVLGVSRDPNAKFTILLVEPKTGRPTLAVKAPTTDLAGRAVEHERRSLEAIHALLPESLARTVPRVVDVVDFEGRIGVVLTAVEGTPMSVAYVCRRRSAVRAGVAADFIAIESWLTAFQRATANGSRRLDLADGLEHQLRRRFAEEPSLEDDLALLAAIDDRLCRETVISTAVHGDLWFGNVLHSDGRVTGVVDWEWGLLSGNGARDLVRLADVHALYLDSGAARRWPGRGSRDWGAALELALTGSGWFADAFRGFLSRGLERLGASPASWRDAALAGIAELAATTDDDGFARRNLELFGRLGRITSRKEAR
jgi:aminoglycoside phosphotransferase (APT) family kinase protein